MAIAKVVVMYKESILDPQGEAVKSALLRLGHDEVKEVRMGKYFEIQLNESENVEAAIEKMCQELLANVTMESYQYEIFKEDEVQK